MKQFYLKSIIEGEKNNQKAIILVLMSRGFLIDENKGKYYLSDNSTMDDLEYLKEGFEECNFGKIVDQHEYVKKSRRNWNKNSLGPRSYEYLCIQPEKVEIIVDEMAEVESAIEFFFKEGQHGDVAEYVRRSWREFSVQDFGEKVSIRHLESYIAFYVKAISSCGVYTNCSCDGNHPNGGHVFVYADYPSGCWHENIWKYLVVPRFGNIPYVGKEITFNKDNQIELYKKLYSIADFLYFNRVKIRKLRAKTIEKLTKKYIDRHSEAEIEKFYQIECERILQGIDIL